jgi:hypothetical protein
MQTSNNFPIVEYPIIAWIGNRGGGKTLGMTAFAVDWYQKEGIQIYSNYHLYGVPYIYMEFTEMINSLDKLYNCLLLIDEAHVGINAFQFLSKGVAKVTTFVTQIRKRKIIMCLSTQRFNRVAKSVREQVDYIVTCSRTSKKGVSNYVWYDMEYASKEVLIWEKVLDLRSYFKYYNTEELILKN